MKKPTLDSQRTNVSNLLAEVELELRHADAADDQMGAHAADAVDKLNTELATRQKAGMPADPDQEAEYLHLLGQRRRAHLVHATATQAKARR